MGLRGDIQRLKHQLGDGRVEPLPVVVEPGQDLEEMRRLALRGNHLAMDYPVHFVMLELDEESTNPMELLAKIPDGWPE